MNEQHQLLQQQSPANSNIHHQQRHGHPLHSRQQISSPLVSVPGNGLAGPAAMSAGRGTAFEQPPHSHYHNGPSPMAVPHAPGYSMMPQQFHPYSMYGYPYPMHYQRQSPQWQPYPIPPMHMGRGYAQGPYHHLHQPNPHGAVPFQSNPLYPSTRPVYNQVPSPAASSIPLADHSYSPALSHSSVNRQSLMMAPPSQPSPLSPNATPTSSSSSRPQSQQKLGHQHNSRGALGKPKDLPSSRPKQQQQISQSIDKIPESIMSKSPSSKTSPPKVREALQSQGRDDSELPSYRPPLPWQSFKGKFAPRAPWKFRHKGLEGSEQSVILPPKPASISPLEQNSKDTASNLLSQTDALHSLTIDRQMAPFPPSASDPVELAKAPVPPDLDKHPSPSMHRSTNSSATILPAIPAISAGMKSPKKTSSPNSPSSTPTQAISSINDALEKSRDFDAHDHSLSDSTSLAPPSVEAQPRPAPKSWAELLRVKAQSNTAQGSIHSTPKQSIADNEGPTPSRATTMAQAINSYDAKEQENSKLAFLEPRGLVNTGNMCYMNSILQVLVFCIPFYRFLDNLGRRAVHTFNSDTPMLDSMIMFLREYKIIDSAVTAEQLRMRLKDNELDQCGESFIPDFVYNVIRSLPRFSSMRRGHQQDAEEFLGFLLEELHDECARTTNPRDGERSSFKADLQDPDLSSRGSASNPPHTPDDEGGWFEVGPKQKSAITRSSGTVSVESPITKIFGGKLRSELRIAGAKTSVTMEPYQTLQLDIGANNVENIVDALKGLTKSETLHGEFNSSRGSKSIATKQVTIEQLPHVLILHLKRFQYDNTGGTQKIWKQIGYPLELDVPKEILPQHKRNALLASNDRNNNQNLKYRLLGVVYHHGKNASGGHYTVDVRRQDGRSWVRLDDTHIRCISSDEVALAGSDGQTRVKSTATSTTSNSREQAYSISKNQDQPQRDLTRTKILKEAGYFTEDLKEPSRDGHADIDSSRYDDDDDSGANVKQNDAVWNHVNGSHASASSATSTSSKPLSNGVKRHPPNTTNNLQDPTPTSSISQQSIKDNKVAYILLYQKIS